MIDGRMEVSSLFCRRSETSFSARSSSTAHWHLSKFKVDSRAGSMWQSSGPAPWYRKSDALEMLRCSSARDGM